MPSSRPNTIPTVIHLVRQLKPRSILDVGVGFGKWGHLFREYTDILEAEHDPARYQRENWQVRIDGIEGFPDYLTEMHRYLYNDIHAGDARKLLPQLPAYDVIFMGDVLEHLSKADGCQLLRDAFACATKAVILTTPKYETDQTDLCGNELERHRSLWSARDFREFEGVITKTVDRSTLLVVWAKPGIPELKVTPPVQPGAAAARRIHRTREALIRTIPLDEALILVDEDQFRHQLPHRQVFPFLEKEGIYWGPPGDDTSAIRELDRLRNAGAKRIAFVWSCFWWLEHFKDFHLHLSRHFKQEIKNRDLVVFDLDAVVPSSL
jgi:hypothetical protein